MTDALKILQNITTDYSVFENDQVLTASQLNNVTNYLNDQTRLTRLYLLGVGVIAGLRVSLSSDDVIKLTPGIGITTDGDLLSYSHETVFDRFLEYDQSYPKYAPFYVNGNTAGEMNSVYELIPQDADDQRSSIFSLGEFSTQTGQELKNMVVVLLMESYEHDPDICTATDCDNLGKDCINRIKLLLVDNINLLKPEIATPDEAYSQLEEIVADRPIIPQSIRSFGELANIYRDICNIIHGKLVDDHDGLPNMYPNCAAFLADVFQSDPTNRWTSQLTRINNDFGSNDRAIQYYYDFLKDVVETYNQFRELLFGDTTWCCADINSFPKHLLLGNLVPGDNADENRIAFYPSPTVSQTRESLNHAKFLAKKLDTLIQTFQVPTSSHEIRITPSLFEDQPLEERAIPYYYQVNETNPIDKSWNYLLTQRGMAQRNYSYSATDYRAEGAAANPLTAQIGRFSFFRIEGHLGKDVETVITDIETAIKDNNLPFTVRSVMLGTDKTKLRKPNIRYTDLHRLHYMLRQDVFHQLGEVAQFSGNFKQLVDQRVTEEPNADVLKSQAKTYDETISGTEGTLGSADTARTKLNRSYSDYIKDQSWKSDLNVTLQAAGQFKYNLGEVAKTEFTTPFDSLIGYSSLQWLDWLDKIIQKKDEQEDEKLLFNKFILQHPGIEHLAGVMRGGTFVLVYDNDSKVVADFMLSYYCPDLIEEEDTESEFIEPQLKPWISELNHGLKILPSFDKHLSDFKGEKLKEFVRIEGLGEFIKADQIGNLVTTQLDNFRFDQLEKIQTRMQTQFENSITLIGNVFSKVDKGELKSVVVGQSAIELLDMMVRETNTKRQTAYLLKEQARRASSEAERRIFQAQVKEAELDLANSIQETTNYISDLSIDVSEGSAGFTAIGEISTSLGAITDNEAFTTAMKGVEEVKDKTNNSQLKLTMLKLQIENGRRLTQ